MTAQVPDTIELDGVQHVVAGIDGTGLFEPGEHGVTPQVIHTGCWRGFLCGYAVVGGELRLAELRLGLGSSIAGTPVEEGTTLLGAAAALDGSQWVFRYDRLLVPFTGSLLAADKFVPGTYVHMGFTPAWKFERVVKVAFDVGRETGRTDLSESMAATRAAIVEGMAGDPDGNPMDPAWIARTFGLGFDRNVPRPPAP